MFNNSFSPPHEFLSPTSAVYFPEQVILNMEQTPRNFIADRLLMQVFP